MTELPDRVRSYLSTHHVLTLCTASRAAVPHATTLLYANDERTFHVWMRADSTTARNMRENPQIAFTIDVYSPDWRKTKGVQASGRAEEIEDAAGRETALLAFEERFPELSIESGADLAFFRLVASEIHFIDSSAGEWTGRSRTLGNAFHRDLVFSVFTDLPAERVEEVMAQLGQVSVAAGDVVVAEGDAADRFFIIVDGEVEVSRSDGGETRVVATLGRGQFFGEIAILRDERRTATVRALRPTTLLTMDRETFRTLVAQSLGTTARLDEIIRQRLEGLDAPTP